MKKVILLIGLIFLLSAFVYADDVDVGDLSASYNGMVTTIYGKVFFEDTGDPVANIFVNVYCRHNGNNNKLAKVKTCPEGGFLTSTFNILPSRMCKAGDMAWIELDYDGNHYKSQEVAVTKPLPHVGKANINYGITTVPEFSTVTLAVAVVVAGLGIAILRKR